MQEHEVVVVGAGPTGMMLAGELALAGVDVAIVERRENQDIEGLRALGLLARSIEVLDQRGIAERFLAAGKTMQIGSFAAAPMDLSDFPTRHNYGLALPQPQIERILAGWIAELPVAMHRGTEVTGVTQDATGVDVAVADGPPLRARYVVGCDGGRSVVRKAAAIAFPGWDPAMSNVIAEVELRETPELGMQHDAHGVHAIAPADEPGRVRVVLRERDPSRTAPPTLEDVRDLLVETRGTDYGLHALVWSSRFTDMTRQAEAYRAGRVMVAGDAAHVHSPVGGQGLNTGLQDAVNLGWKLAQVVHGISPDGLLDTYHDERHPVGARVLRTTMALTTLSRIDDRMAALRDMITEVASLDEPRRRLAGRLSALDIHYDLGEGHPLLGRRMPDLDLVTPGGPRRVYELLHQARPALVNLGAPLDLGPWSDRVPAVEATYDGAWELPVLGAVAAPDAVLIRPDGHVAWVGEGTDEGLAGALATWFGPATA